MLVPFIILYFINEEKSNTCGINFVGDLVDNSYNQGMKHAQECQLCFRHFLCTVVEED